MHLSAGNSVYVKDTGIFKQASSGNAIMLGEEQTPVHDASKNRR
jgi:hypothetical protein